MSDDEDPHSRAKQNNSPSSFNAESRAVTWFRGLLRGRVSNTNNLLQEALEDYIDELKEADQDDAAAESQKLFITNVIKTHDLKISDVMVPRVDIVAIDQDATPDEFKALFAEDQFSRIPVYRGDLDHIVGILHIKDILSHLLNGKSYALTDLVREAMIVSPGMPLMDLFLSMRNDKKHMALVVDEHGGIDGLITMNDVIEAIVGDIEDEFDNDEQPQILQKPDGSLLVEGRMDIEDFEEIYGNVLNAEEREDIDTLGGLIFSLAGRVPKRGESFKHESGMVLEVIEADSRRVTRMRIRNLPSVAANDEV